MSDEWGGKLKNFEFSFFYNDFYVQATVERERDICNVYLNAFADELVNSKG